MNLSNYAENKLLDHLLGTTSFTMPTQVYVALFTTDPTDAGTGSEVGTGAYPSYARKAIDFVAASGGNADNSGEVTWSYDGSGDLTISHIALYDASTAGNMLMHGPLEDGAQNPITKTLSNGDSFSFPIGNFNASMD